MKMSKDIITIIIIIFWPGEPCRHLRSILFLYKLYDTIKSHLNDWLQDITQTNRVFLAWVQRS